MVNFGPSVFYLFGPLVSCLAVQFSIYSAVWASGFCLVNQFVVLLSTSINIASHLPCVLSTHSLDPGLVIQQPTRVLVLPGTCLT